MAPPFVCDSREHNLRIAAANKGLNDPEKRYTDQRDSCLPRTMHHDYANGRGDGAQGNSSAKPLASTGLSNSGNQYFTFLPHPVRLLLLGHAEDTFSAAGDHSVIMLEVIRRRQRSAPPLRVNDRLSLIRLIDLLRRNRHSWRALRPGSHAQSSPSPHATRPPVRWYSIESREAGRFRRVNSVRAKSPLESSLRALGRDS